MSDHTIIVKKISRTFQLTHIGRQGVPGQPGRGVPTGGVTGQVLAKLSDADGDSGWETFDAADKYFTQEFLPTTFVNVNHALNKKPAVTIIDSAGDEVEGDILFVDNNNITVSFSAAFGGSVTCN